MHSLAFFKKYLSYNPKTGIFTWRLSPNVHVLAGTIAGKINDQGYVLISLKRIEIRAHRLAWFFMTGEWPKNQIDHRNRKRNDNRWRNLREATHAQNSQNMKIFSTNTSGYTGVDWYPNYGLWRARICFNYKTICIGYFDTIEEAVSARAKKKAELHQFNPLQSLANTH